MTTSVGKSCSFGLLCGLSRTFITFCGCLSFPFSWGWDLIALIPDQCLPIYFPLFNIE